MNSVESLKHKIWIKSLAHSKEIDYFCTKKGWIEHSRLVTWGSALEDNEQQSSNLEQIYCACWPFSLVNLCRMRKNVANVFLLGFCVCICMCLVEDLSEIVPELLSKLRVVEEKKPVNNVSTNILKIRELIAQARSVAKKVHQAMQINITLNDPHAEHNTFSHSHIQNLHWNFILVIYKPSTQTYQKFKLNLWRVAQKS